MYHIPEPLIRKYAVIGPRYTSYPTAPMWSEIDRSTQEKWLLQAQTSKRPLAFYIHIPFCRERCYYCGCNVFVTRRQEQSAEYVTYLLKELDRLKTLQNGNRKIRQLHFGGGTPTFLLDEEFRLIMNKIGSIFEFEDDAEIAIEIDPCTLRPKQLEFLRELGVNRLSLGVQDFDEKVQKAVNRIQSREITSDLLRLAKKLGIEGINFDLIYGLPCQTLESFQRTLDSVIKMRPDRLAVYNFGYLPQRMPHQRKIDPQALPDEKTKLSILFETIRLFAEAGYRYIGMDHFALPEDELSLAQNGRTLYRNFMGYTAKSGVDLMGIGMTAISEFGPYFLQNEKKMKSYKEQIDDDGLAGCRGLELSRDDQIRKWTILRLICHFYLSFEEFKNEFEIDFRDYFQEEMAQLGDLQNDGLLELNADHLVVVNHGKILVRNICMVFDAYLKNKDIPSVRYSKTI
ncbi:MAG: oxygen-independent coproporphyrinogen III oxidase [Proteobacteria bacterium]|nr:oxygen-independent coproporphyrinogen III oxidase [Pseudomonadota bacterium]